jgi:hypothetical protein
MRRLIDQASPQKIKPGDEDKNKEKENDNLQNKMLMGWKQSPEKKTRSIKSMFNAESGFQRLQ